MAAGTLSPGACVGLLSLALTADWRPGLADDLVHEKEKFKSVSDELDTTFSEMSAY